MFKNFLIAAVLMLTASVVSADEGEKTVRDAMHSLLPNMTVYRVVKSEMPGFYEVVVSGQVVYISADGKYLMQGNLYNVSAKKNLIEGRVAAMRLDALQKLPKEKQLVFAADHPKHSIFVFSDVDCPYCRQFHKQI